MKAKKKSKLFQWQQKGKLGGTCAICFQHVEILTVDHIIPVSILEVLDNSGLAAYDDEENFQLICLPCNAFKAFRLDKKNPMTKKILLKYL